MPPEQAGDAPLWLQITARGADPDILDEALFAAGALSVTLTDAADTPILEPALGTHPTWPDTVVVGLFEATVNANQAMALVRQLAPESDLHAAPLEDRDWVRAWMDDFQPMRFGARLWVCPAGMNTAGDDAVRLRLDPGLAFGTGTHPTTAMCLQWLDAQDLRGKRVLDYGCGSGILAIAAALLGAEHLAATDIDPQALTATADNAARNGVAVASFTVDALPEQRHDIVLANILAGPLCALAPKLLALLDEGGALVLAGLLADQVGEVQAAYADHVRLQIGAQNGDWVRLQGRRETKN